MKSIIVTCLVALAVALCSTADAEMVGGQNWADDVADFNAGIQDYAGTTMDDSKAWWLTGAPDDYVAGWRGGGAADYIVMHWDSPLADEQGDDLVIRLFGGPKASALVLASVDGVDYTQVGVLGKGSPEVYREERFDLGGQFDAGVSFVKVERTASGNGTGMFFDAFGSVSVPEPGIAAMSALGFACLLSGRRRMRCSR
jgi:hypothetical protein